jgi:tetratricopeptide (TPR) repeat protein
LTEQALAHAREPNDNRLTAATLNNLGLILTDHGDFPAAQSWLEEALPMAREIAELPLTAISLKNLGRVITYRADYRRAVGLLEEKPGDC